MLVLLVGCLALMCHVSDCHSLAQQSFCLYVPAMPCRAGAAQCKVHQQKQQKLAARQIPYVIAAFKHMELSAFDAAYIYTSIGLCVHGNRPSCIQWYMLCSCAQCQTYYLMTTEIE